LYSAAPSPTAYRLIELPDHPIRRGKLLRRAANRERKLRLIEGKNPNASHSPDGICYSVEIRHGLGVLDLKARFLRRVGPALAERGDSQQRGNGEFYEHMVETQLGLILPYRFRECQGCGGIARPTETQGPEPYQERKRRRVIPTPPPLEY
jgi:hypothetical protein